MKNFLTLSWSESETPEELRRSLEALAESFPLHKGIAAKGSLDVSFERVPGSAVEVTRDGPVARIRYGAVNLALRGVSSLLAGLVCEGDVYREEAPFTTFGIMLDCSRNAVMNVPHLKVWFRQLALLGYNQVMLYMEDTYEIPGEPYFGYQRGRYTTVELRELDAYAAALGIELVGCIQTLAHLEQITRWEPYQSICDFRDTLLVGEEGTYTLAGKMLDAISGNLATRRIHIGMDEAWSLGRGAFLDRFGQKPRFEILNEHLQRLVQQCEERGLKPMIWSDMYFRIGSPRHDYYDPACQIPAEVVAAIPKTVELVYWDYYHSDKAFYLDWIARHRDMGFEPVMASGVWTWGQFWYNRELTEANAGACLDACREAGLKDVVFTMWGDDGGYCDFDSALTGLAWAAERGFVGSVDANHITARFRTVCGGDYNAAIRASDVNAGGHAPALLWDDPLLGLFSTVGCPPSADWTWKSMGKQLTGVRDFLKIPTGPHAAGNLEHAQLLADVLAQKLAWRQGLEQAYPKRNRAELVKISAEACALSGRMKELMESWRGVWMAANKPQGFEVIQIRLSTQAVRFEEAHRRLDELLSGAAEGIPELEEKPPALGIRGDWRTLASGSVIV